MNPSFEFGQSFPRKEVVCLKFLTPLNRVAPVRFGSVTVWGWNGSSGFPVFGSGGSSKEGVFVCFSTVSQRGRFRFRFRFLKNGSGGSGSAFSSCENRFRRFRFPVPVRFLGHAV